MTSYRSARELEERFGGRRVPAAETEPFGLEFQIESYLEARSEWFVDNFDPNAYLYLSRAMDLFDAADHGETLVDALGRIEARAFQVIGVESDALFPLRQQDALAEALEDAQHAAACRSRLAKGARCLPRGNRPFGPLISTFLGGYWSPDQPR